MSFFRTLSAALSRNSRARGRRAPRRLRPRFALAYEQLEPRRLLSFVPQLLGDLYPHAASSNPSLLTALNDQVYFAAERALWKTDGTAAGTIRVKENAFPPAESTFPSLPGMAASGSLLYFNALDGPTNFDLWRSDGTELGTFKLKDLLPSIGQPTARAMSLTDVNGTLYFSPTDSMIGNELWKSDGTIEGTTLIKDITPGSQSSSPYGFTPYKGLVYFATIGGGLWKTDGTQEGTVFVKQTETFDSPNDFTVVGDTLYFTAGGRLWKSDGTTAGTVLVNQNLRDADYLVKLNGSLYFTGELFSIPQVWTLAGANLVQVSDFPSSTSNVVRNLTVAGNQLFFVRETSSLRDELWVSDGTRSGTQLLRGGPFPAPLTEFGAPLAVGKIIYITDTFLYSVWRSDGTVAGTQRVTNFSGPIAAQPDQLTAVGERVCFVASTSANGRELWVTDGTSQGTSIVRDIRLGGAGSSGAELRAFRGKLAFTAIDEQPTTQLFISDGTPEGPQPLLSTVEFHRPEELTVLNDVLYFEGNDGSEQAIFTTDGTSAGTRRVARVRSTFNFVASGDRLFFSADNSSLYGRELWTTDGTEPGTHMVRDIVPGGTDSLHLTDEMVGADGLLFFEVRGDLWRSDGTEAGTYLVSDISPGTTSLSVNDFVVLNGRLFFTVLRSNDLGRELWTSDGTDAGTHLVKDISPGTGSSAPFSLVGFRDAVYFVARDPVHGYRIWRTDGTEEGTQPVIDIEPGDLRPDLLTVLGNSLYFQTTRQLWKSDGTAPGTHLVADLSALSPSGTPVQLLAVGDQLFFTVFDLAHGSELWQSDGTAAGTRMMADIWPGATSSSPTSLTDVNGTLYFLASDFEHGQEPYVLLRRANSPTVTPAMSDNREQTENGLLVTRNTLDGNEVAHVKITNIAHGALFLNDGVTPVVDGDFVSFDEAELGFKFTPAAGFSGTATFGVQASTSDDDEGLGGDVVTAKIFVVPVFTNANDTLYLIANTNQTEVEVFDLDPFQFAVPPLISWPTDLADTLNLNTLGGDDQIIVQLPAGMHGPAGGIRFDTGAGSNLLTVRGGNVHIDGTSTGGNLITIVTAGAQLTTSRLDQLRLALQGTDTKVTLLPGGGVSVLDDLELSLGTTLDVTNNSLVLHSSESNKDGRYTDLRAKILNAQNGVDPNFVTNWNGTGITSSSARTSNVATGFDLVSLGMIRNSDIDVITGLPGSAYTSFGAEPVGPHDLLLKYTYIGDGNLDGLVSFDDYVGTDNAFFGLIPNLGWATGDINFDNAINFDDYTVVDQAFFFQAAPLASVGEPEASAPGVIADFGSHAVPDALDEFRTPSPHSALSLPAASEIPNSALRSHRDTDSRISQPTDSLADPRLATSRRSISRDLWDTALLDVLH